MTTATEDGTSVTVDLGVVAGLTAGLGRVADEMTAQRVRQDRLAQHVRRFTVPPQPMTITSNAGTLDVPNLLGPVTGCWWDIRRIACTGFSAGAVTVYLSQANGETVAIFSSAGVQTFGKAQVLLGGGDRLYFSAASITGSVTVSIAGIEISAPYIGDYLI